MLWAEVRDGEPVAPAFITSKSGAMYLSSLDRPMFRNVSAVGGGTISGVPLIISRAATNRLVLVDGGSIIVSDNGLVLDTGYSASVQLTNEPVSSPAQLVSAFQTNSGFLRAVRTVHWQKAHDDAVAYLELPLLTGGSPS